MGQGVTDCRNLFAVAFSWGSYGRVRGLRGWSVPARVVPRKRAARARNEDTRGACLFSFFIFRFTSISLRSLSGCGCEPDNEGFTQIVLCLLANQVLFTARLSSPCVPNISS